MLIEIESMTAIALLLSFQNIQFPATPVTLDGQAMRLESLVPLISEKTKFKFKVSPELRNDVVFLKIDGMPLDKLTSRLADISLAKWTDTPEGPMLGRDTNKLTSALNAEIQQRVAIFQKAQAVAKEKTTTAPKPTELIDALKKHVNSPDAYSGQGFERMQALQRQFPMGDAAVRIANAIPAADLDAIFRSKRVVFALEPNKMQRKMPQAVTDILRQTWANLLSFGEAIKAMPREEAQSVINGGQVHYLTGFTGEPPAMNGTWWVTATAMDSSISFAVEYRGSVGALQGFHQVGAFAPAGTGISSEDTSDVTLKPDSQTLLDAYVTADPQAQGYVTITVQDDKDPDKRYPLSYTYRRMFPVVPKLAPELYAQVLAPDRNDPLSYWLSDALKQGATSQKKNLIAWLGDDLFPTSLAMFRAKLTVKDFLASPRLWRGYKWSDSDGLLTLKPEFHSTAVTNRGDRARFGAALRDLAETGAMRERTLLNWAGAQTRQPDRQYEDYSVRLVNPMGFDMNHLYRQWMGMGLLGMLPQGDLDRLKRGEKLPYSSLSPQLKSRLAGWAFTTNDPLYDMENWKPDDAASGARFSSLDATFRFPQGVPATGYLGLTYRPTAAYLARYPGGQLAEPETALQTASRMWVASKPRETNVVSLPSPESFRQGEERLFRLNMYLDPAWAMSSEFTTFEVTGGTVKGFAGLPASHKEEVTRLLNIFIKSSGVGSATGTPPPR